ncbi:MAG: hypothetical protein BGO58_11285 [Sphingopyxis sp. 65-8]|nr:MAG: hypothetical protein BGO58_11285 [Sphingopyxis sp. 65-8]
MKLVSVMSPPLSRLRATSFSHEAGDTSSSAVPMKTRTGASVHHHDGGRLRGGTVRLEDIALDHRLAVAAGEFDRFNRYAIR